MDRNPIKRRPAAHGFTLIELLTVIVIIGLLLGILIPTIKGVIQQAYATRTMVRLKTIADATDAYFGVNRFYPGQDDYTQLGAGGSTMLARYLLSDSDGKFGSAATKSTYLTYSADLVQTPGNAPSALMDCFPVAMPIFYYVSRGKGLSSTAQYQWSDNTLTAGTNDPTVTNQAQFWANVAQNPSFSNTKTGGTIDIPYNDGAFILIAPGVDRLYFNADDNMWPGR